MNYEPVNLAYKRFEPVDGLDDSLCPVIFLHGLTVTMDMWLDMPQVIADKTKRTAYAVDARNHGDSEFSDFFSFDVNAVDLIHFMEEMNISKASLVGLSMGSLTAFRVALQKPEKVEMFFSGDMHPRKIPKEIIDMLIKSIELYDTVVESTPTGISEKDAVQYIIDGAYDEFAKVPKEIKPQQPYRFVPKENYLNGRIRLRSKPDGTYGLRYNKDAIINFLKTYKRDSHEYGGEYDGPAYFIYGGASMFNVKVEEELIKKLFPRAEMIEFEGASHDVVGDCWERFINTVLKGLKK